MTDKPQSHTTDPDRKWLAKSQALITNLRHWISHGLSETAVGEIDDYWRKWQETDDEAEAQRRFDAGVPMPVAPTLEPTEAEREAELAASHPDWPAYAAGLLETGGFGPNEVEEFLRERGLLKTADPKLAATSPEALQTTPSWSIEDTRALAPEAFREALTRYPNDVEGALIFFSHAIGLSIQEPTAEDIARAQNVIEDLHHAD